MRNLILLLWGILPAVLWSQTLDSLAIAQRQLAEGHYLPTRLTLDKLADYPTISATLQYQLLSAKTNYYLGEFELADRQIDTLLQQTNITDLTYWDALLTKAEIHTSAGSFIIADSLLQQVEQQQKLPTKWQFRIKNDRAQWALWKKDFPLAEQLLTTHLSYQDSLQIPITPAYLRTLYHLVDVHLWQGDFVESQHYFERGEQFAIAKNLLEHNYYSELCELGGYLFFELENYQQALHYRLTAQTLFKRDYGKKHPRSRVNESSIGTTYYFLEDFPNAEKYLLPSIELSATEIAELDTLYSQRLFNIASMYAEGGDDKRAYQLAQQAEQIWLDHQGSRGEYFGVLCAYLGEIAARLNYNQVAKEYLAESITILTKEQAWMRLIHAYNQQAKLQLKSGKNTAAQQSLRTALKLKQQLAQPSFALVETYQLLGKTALAANNNQTALRHFYTAKQLQSEVSGTRSIAYAELENQCAQVLAKVSHHPLVAHKSFSRANALLIQQIKYVFPTLDEKTRVQFLKKTNAIVHPFIDFVMQNQQNKPDLVTELLDLKIAIDGIGLENSRNVLFADPQRQVDDTLYHHWSQQRKALRAAFNLSSAERVTAEIDLQELQYTVQLAEKKLGWKNKTTQQIDLDNTAVRANWSKKEAVIDFFQYHIRDTTFYVAMVLRSEQTHLIPLTTDTNLRPFLDRQFTPTGNHYINNTDQQAALYKLIWQPLTPFLQGIKQVAIIPTGWLHRVAFATLADAQKSLLQHYEIVYYSTLRDIFSLKKGSKSKRNIPSITLFGGAIYDAPFTEETEILAMSETPTATVTKLSHSLRGDSLRNAISFTYLPATKTEVEQITQLATTQNWTANSYTDKAAAEENLKNSTGQNAPTVLHLATHGFFFPALNVGDVATKNLRENLLLVQNPLLRSGLALTGANETWLNGKAVANREDGILTAYEIYDLDLQQTELVVLSACETARGDAVAGEGIFGLQRAFKIAGVDQLLLSLWQVPDAATAQLMQQFYQYYFKGATATIALRKAQLDLQKTHNNYDWGAFILLK